MNVTVPVGFVEPVTVGVTVAVKVTGWLTLEEDGEAAMAMVVGVAVTIWDTVPGVPGEKFASPL